MEALYGKQRKALKYIYNKTKNNIYVTHSELSKYLNLSHSETMQLINILRNKDYLIIIGLDSKLKSSVKCTDYFSAETTIAFETIIKSIICPIIVSFLTTLIAIWLSE